MSELVFQYNEFFCYEEFEDCLAPEVAEYIMMPMNMMLYSVRGDMKSLLDTPLLFEAHQMFERMGINNLDGRSGFIYRSCDHPVIRCDALFMQDGILKRDTFELPLDVTFIIEPAVKTGEETTII